MTQDGTTPPAYRPVRLSGQPTVAVVVLSGGAPDRVNTLHALAADCSATSVELAVVCSAPTPDPARWERAFPGVRFVWQDGLPEAEARARGLAAVDGDIVVFAREEEAAAPGWLRARLAGWPGFTRRRSGRRRSVTLPRRPGAVAPIANQNNGLT